MKINTLFCSFSLPSPVSHPATFPWRCPILQPMTSHHKRHYHTSYKTSTQRRGPSHSKLLNKARFFKMISYRLSAIRKACGSLKWLSTKFESVRLQTQMHPVLSEQWSWITDRKLSLLHCIYHPQQFLSFFSISVLPPSHNDPKRKKKQPPARQRNFH